MLPLVPEKVWISLHVSNTIAPIYIPLHRDNLFVSYAVRLNHGAVLLCMASFAAFIAMAPK